MARRGKKIQEGEATSSSKICSVTMPVPSPLLSERDFFGAEFPCLVSLSRAGSQAFPTSIFKIRPNHTVPPADFSVNTNHHPYIFI